MTVGELVDAGFATLQTGPFRYAAEGSGVHGSGRPLLNVKNVGIGDVCADRLEFVSNETAKRLSAHILEAGDIVFGRKGAVDRHAYIPLEFTGAVQGSDCLRLRLDRNRVLPRFVSFALRTAAHRAWMHNQCSHGATMASLNQDIVRRIELPAFPLETQGRVVEILGAIDDLIENNRRRIALLEQMAQAIYREWFVHFRYPGHEDDELVDSALGPIPAGWNVRNVHEVATIIRGRSYRKQDLVEAGGVPFINLKCMERGGGFRRDGLKRYAGLFKPEQETRPGDIVLAVTDLTQGREILARATRSLHWPRAQVSSHSTLPRSSPLTTTIGYRSMPFFGSRISRVV